MITTESKDNYIYSVNGRRISLDKEMVDKYSEIVCPVDEDYVVYLIQVFGQDNCEDNVLSFRLALDMSRELSGYGR